MARKTSPLSVLIVRLQPFGPPSLSAMISKFGDVEEYQEFVMLIRDYLPEYEAEILRQPSQGAQIQNFATRFRDRYFPLAYHVEYMVCDMDFQYSDLTRGIPVEPRGWTYDEYDMLSTDARPGLQLMAHLLESPYDIGDGVSLAEACSEHVPIEMLNQVPEGGIKYDLIGELFKDSPYKPIAMLADWWFQNTGNFFLDTDYEMMFYNMGEPPWDMETVETLTRQWQQADEYQEEVENFLEWLEGDIQVRFQEILDFIAGKEVNKLR